MLTPWRSQVRALCRPFLEVASSVDLALLAGRCISIGCTWRCRLGKIGKEGAGFFFAKPAVVAPRVDVRIPELWRTTAAKSAEFPKDLSVAIKKEGGEPAKIHVKRGEKEWNVAEDKLDDLPGDIRHYVEQMLGKGIGAYKAVRMTPGTQLLSGLR